MDITTNIAIKQSQHHTHKSTTIITSTRIALCGAMMHFCSLIFTGCATDLSSLNTFSTSYYEHSPHKAYEFATKKAKTTQIFYGHFKLASAHIQPARDKPMRFWIKAKRFLIISNQKGFFHRG